MSEEPSSKRIKLSPTSTNDNHHHILMEDVLIQVFSFLDIGTLLSRVALSCKKWNHLLMDRENDHFWISQLNHLIQQEFDLNRSLSAEYLNDTDGSSSSHQKKSSDDNDEESLDSILMKRLQLEGEEEDDGGNEDDENDEEEGSEEKKKQKEEKAQKLKALKEQLTMEGYVPYVYQYFSDAKDMYVRPWLNLFDTLHHMTDYQVFEANSWIALGKQLKAKKERLMMTHDKLNSLIEKMKKAQVVALSGEKVADEPEEEEDAMEDKDEPEDEPEEGEEEPEEEEPEEEEPEEEENENNDEEGGEGDKKQEIADIVPTVNDFNEPSIMDLCKRRYLLLQYQKKKLPRIKLSEEDSCDEDKTFKCQQEDFLKNKEKYQELALGVWEDPSDLMDSETFVDLISWLSEHAKELNHLRALSLADIEQQEAEVSWIRVGDITPVLRDLPNILYLTSKGMMELKLSPIMSHNLVSLTFVTGGLDHSVFKGLMAGCYPNLAHLEIWLGTSDYGLNIPSSSIQSLLLTRKENGKFPRLEYLGLRNYQKIDTICAMIFKSAIARRVRIIDISNGTLSSTGVKAILQVLKKESAMEQFKLLEILDVSRSYINEPELKKLFQLPFIVNATKNETGSHSDDRYISLSE